MGETRIVLTCRCGERVALRPNEIKVKCPKCGAAVLAVREGRTEATRGSHG